MRLPTPVDSVGAPFRPVSGEIDPNFAAYSSNLRRSDFSIYIVNEVVYRAHKSRMLIYEHTFNPVLPNVCFQEGP